MPTHDSTARTLAASPLDRPKSRKLGEPQFSRVPDHVYSTPASDRLLVVLFFAAIFLPFLAYLRGIESGQALDEKRNLAPKPKFLRSELSKWPEQIDAYYRDWFGFRRRLIQWQNTARYLWLESSNEDLKQGKQHWLFYARERTLQNHMGLDPFTPAALDSWVRHLEQRHKVLSDRGIHYMFAMAPDKPSIYPELLPDAVRNHLGETKADQLVAALRAKQSPLTFIDLRKTLLEAKREGVVYYPQDTHWNGRGLFMATNEILGHVQKLFPEVQLLQLGVDYRLEPGTWEGGDWNLFGLPDENRKYVSEFLVRTSPLRSQEVPFVLPSGVRPLLQRWNQPRKFVNSTATRRVLVIHDSFLRTGIRDSMHRVLADSFAAISFFGHKPTLVELVRLVEQEQPDLVIEELIERSIATWLEPEELPPLPAKKPTN